MPSTAHDIGGAVRQIVDRVGQRLWVLGAPAKVNLRLKVLGRRADGYHLLSMLNTTCALSDELRVRLRHDSECAVSIDLPELQSVASADNLVTKAFRNYWKVFGCDEPPCGIDVAITKRIPVGGGLGGGSSDAGAILRLLTELFQGAIEGCLGIDRSEYLSRIAAAALACGADVPYAYSGGVCWVTGIGEDVRPISGGPLWGGTVLIVAPPKPVPTALFYDRFRAQHPHLTLGVDAPMERFRAHPDPVLLPDLLENDFEGDVCQLVPEVGEGLIRARCFFPHTTSLTGSGSCFFSLVNVGEEGRIPAFTEALHQVGMAVHVTHF